eukprot:12880079-Prorocentrum_lima.AAC.1
MFPVLGSAMVASKGVAAGGLLWPWVGVVRVVCVVPSLSAVVEVRSVAFAIRIVLRTSGGFVSVPGLLSGVVGGCVC